MAGSPRLKVSQFITLAKWTLVAVLLVAVLLAALKMEMTRSGTAIVTMLSAIRGCTAALYVFSCLDDQRGDAVKAAGCSDHLLQYAKTQGQKHF